MERPEKRDSPKKKKRKRGAWSSAIWQRGGGNASKRGKMWGDFDRAPNGSRSKKGQKTRVYRGGGCEYLFAINK